MKPTNTQTNKPNFDKMSTKGLIIFNLKTKMNETYTHEKNEQISTK
jgi:hypothetical protein